MPSHKHDIYGGTNTKLYYKVTNAISGSMYAAFSGSNTGTSVSAYNTGGGKAHNNLQPYYTAYMWRRTA